MSVEIFPVESGFPQTSGNRTVSDILDDLADYVGGGDRPAAKDRARRALQAALRTFNMEAWRFNRMRHTVTLINNVSDYTLNSDWRSPRAAILLDTNSKAVCPLEWVPYENWARYEADESGTGGSPEAYTARNVFLAGTITFVPSLGTINTQYPTVRLDYHRRITVPSSDDSVLLVPSEVEEAIVQEAIGVIVAKTRSFVEANVARAYARDMFERCKREWRDFPDSGYGNES